MSGSGGIPAVGTAGSAGPIRRDGRGSKFSTPARRFTAGAFRRRRERLAEELGEGVAVLLGAKSVLDAWEEHRLDPAFRVGTFRQEVNLFYLTGLEVPGAAVVLDLDRGETEVFLGETDGRHDPELERLGLPEARPLEDLESAVAERVRGRTACLAVRPGSGPSLRSGFGEQSAFPSLLPGGTPETWPDDLLRRRFGARFEPARIRSLLPAVRELRRTKGGEETGAVRAAVDVTVEGFRTGIASVAPGVDDREVAAEMGRELRRRGAQREAFPPLVQSGPDVLRSFVDVVDSYDRLNRTMGAGELALLDYGAEVDYYVADLARTVPVSGRFSPDQRLAYETYLEAYRAGLDAIRPGAPLMAAAAATARAFEDRLPVLPDWLRSAAADFARRGAELRPGHFLGLELHDHEEYRSPLRSGEVIAYEHHFRVPDRGWRITVEDDVLVTDDGREVLSEALPRDPDALEALMAEGRDG